MKSLLQLREMTRDELLQRKLEIDEGLFNLRMQKAFKEIENPLRLRTLRKELARINTILREDELKIKLLSSERKKEEIPEGKDLEEKDVSEKQKKDKDR
jgi:large subunit ribosomal protein L29